MWVSGRLTAEARNYGRLVIHDSGGVASTLVRTVTTIDGDRVVTALGRASGAPDMWVDGDAPLDAGTTAITYTLGGATLSIPPDALARDWPLLSNPVAGESASVIGAELGDRSWASSTAVHWLDVTAAGYPAVAARPEQAATQALTFYTTSRWARRQVDRLTADRAPLLLRTPDEGLEDIWFVLAGERAEQRIASQDVNEEWRRHTWTLIPVDRPTAPHALNNLGNIAAATPANLGAIASRWPTLGAVAAAELGVENTDGLP